MPDMTFTLTLEAALRDEFVAEAEASHKAAPEIVADLIRDFVHRQREARAHDLWFREQVSFALEQANDPSVERIPNEFIEAGWRRQREALLKRLG